VRVLHTGDWHVGKKLGRFDRSDECERVLSELVETARAAEADIVLVAGDLFDRALPPFVSLRLVLTTLVELAATGAHVVAIAGNHDSSDLFEVLGPYVEPFGIHLVHKPLRPEEGGVMTIPSRAGSSRAQIACFPFLHEAQVLDFMDPSEEWFKSYADRIRRVSAHYSEWMLRHGDRDTVDLLVGHFMVHGARPSGSERELHIGEAYMATSSALPAGVHYTALGHIHRCQPAPGAAAEAWYAGSVMQLDFGEASQDKFCLMADVTPDRTRVERVPLTSGRALLRVEDTLESLRGRAGEFGDAILDVGVLTDGPSPGLADRVRAFLPNALHVRAVYERAEAMPRTRDGMSLDELYADYVRKSSGVDPGAGLMDAFRELRDLVGVRL
jgi:DNA repair protein SbcD/Mre11